MPKFRKEKKSSWFLLGCKGKTFLHSEGACLKCISHSLSYLVTTVTIDGEETCFVILVSLNIFLSEWYKGSNMWNTQNGTWFSPLQACSSLKAEFWRPLTSYVPYNMKLPLLEVFHVVNNNKLFLFEILITIDIGENAWLIIDCVIDKKSWCNCTQKILS